MKKIISHWSLPALFFFILLMALPVSAVSITESPDVLHRGEQITISMTDLSDGSLFSLLIEGQFIASPGERFSFQTRNFNMPVSLNNGQISATTQGTQVTAFSVKKDGPTFNVLDSADAGGFFSISQPYTISSGLYEFLKLEGIARTDTTILSTSMNLMGTKQGQKNSQITFTIDGIDNGVVRVIILVDNNQALYKTVMVGTGVPTQTTTTTIVPTTTATTTVPTTTQMTATTTQPTATSTTQPGANVTQTTAATTTQPVTAQTSSYPVTTTATTSIATITSTTALPSKTFYSADRKVFLTAYDVDYAGLLMVKPTSVPDNWLALTEAYTIAPDSLFFTPEATISFTIPKPSNPNAEYAYFVGWYENNGWLIVPSTAQSMAIEGKINRAGTYALMAFKPESTIPVSGTPATQQTAPATVTPKGTPRIASIAVESSPAPGPTKAPMGLIPLFGALATGIFMVMYHRKLL